MKKFAIAMIIAMTVAISIATQIPQFVTLRVDLSRYLNAALFSNYIFVTWTVSFVATVLLQLPIILTIYFISWKSYPKINRLLGPHILKLRSFFSRRYQVS